MTAMSMPDRDDHGVWTTPAPMGGALLPKTAPCSPDDANAPAVQGYVPLAYDADHDAVSAACSAMLVAERRCRPPEELRHDMRY
jgi:hypothetical protein